MDGAKNKKLFPQKLWDLINDDRYNFCLRWSDDGEFVYLNRDEFEDSYLKTSENQFHTQKAISFVRQMNMYGFRKVDDCYYENDNFKRDREHLLKHMIRKHTNKNSSSSSSSSATATAALKLINPASNQTSFQDSPPNFHQQNEHPLHHPSSRQASFQDSPDLQPCDYTRQASFQDQTSFQLGELPTHQASFRDSPDLQPCDYTRQATFQESPNFQQAGEHPQPPQAPSTQPPQRLTAFQDQPPDFQPSEHIRQDEALKLLMLILHLNYYLPNFIHQ